MKTANRDAARLLQELGNIYRRAGQTKRALVLLLLANQIQPGNPTLLRHLALAFTAVGDGERALAALDALEALQGPAPGLLLLRSRALLQAGRRDEARQLFRRYIAERGGSAR